jgi:hypothetical protein
MNKKKIQIDKEAYDECIKTITGSIHKIQREIRENKFKINDLASKQRLLKAQTGKLYEILYTLKKNVK